MEAFIALCQHHDNKENIPLFLKTHHNKLTPNMTLKKKKMKKNNYRKPLIDITNLLLNSPIHLPETSSSFLRLQSPAICRSKAAGNQMSVEDGCCKSLSCQPRLVEIIRSVGGSMVDDSEVLKNDAGKEVKEAKMNT
ncbi:hypothetical protein L6452_15561 [Arctium lappa]|uniref:Uncharacterized protein n=1 Tax=Arctium lappa TaxID=4217 RepID=A0ACB9CP48_ARCLA|nr:hypothetical protein L6452_15561 [Arctium lappa]